MYSDSNHPFFKPLWRRVLIVGSCLVWSGFEWWNGEQLWGASLPGGHPFGDILQPAERARRLGQFFLAVARIVPGAAVLLRHLPDKGADIVEGKAGGGHGTRLSDRHDLKGR